MLVVIAKRLSIQARNTDSSITADLAVLTIIKRLETS